MIGAHLGGQIMRLDESLGQSQRHQFILGGEMAVEAAMGEAHGFHQLRDTHPLDAAFAKQPGRGADDLLAVFGGVFLGSAWHGQSPWPRDLSWSHPDIYDGYHPN